LGHALAFKEVDGGEKVMGSSSLFSVPLEILLKGTLGVLISAALMCAGLLIGNVYAWIPIFITIALCTLVFSYRLRKQITKEIEEMKRGLMIQGAAEGVEEYKELLRKKGRLRGDQTG
jgi:hypothetical protein